jgi:hypothetical protein
MRILLFNYSDSINYNERKNMKWSKLDEFTFFLYKYFLNRNDIVLYDNNLILKNKKKCELSRKYFKEDYLLNQLKVVISKKANKNYSKMNENDIINLYNKFKDYLQEQFNIILNNTPIDLMICRGNYELDNVLCEIIKNELKIPYMSYENSFIIDHLYFDSFGPICNIMKEMKYKWNIIDKNNIKINDNVSKFFNSCFYDRGQVSQPEEENDKILKEKILSKNKNFNFNKQTILIVGQVDIDSVVILEDTFNNIESFIKYAIDSIDKDKYNIIIRFHPRDVIVYNYFYNDDYYKNNFCMFIEYEVNTYNLIKFSDIIIVLNSQLGLEAALMGKPVVVCGNPFYNISDGIYIDNNLNLSEVILSACNKEKLNEKVYNIKKFFSFLYNDYMVTCENTEENLKKINQKIKMSIDSIHQLSIN